MLVVPFWFACGSVQIPPGSPSFASFVVANTGSNVMFDNIRTVDVAVPDFFTQLQRMIVNVMAGNDIVRSSLFRAALSAA